ncbi:MAG: 4Fe-4S dicluster domain-containing protein [Thermodesulfobacteriota bacterium]
MLIIGRPDADRFINGLKNGLKKEHDFIDVTDKLLSPKEYFFPLLDTTFTFSIKDAVVSTPAPPRSFVLWGLSLRDLEAITYLDEIMSTPEKDYYYFRRRGRALLVGLTEEKFSLPPGGDIILSVLEKDALKVSAVTLRGERAVKKYLPRIKSFKERRSHTRPVPAPRAGEEGTMTALRRLLMDAERLKDAVQWSWKGYPKLWERLMGECLGCGICTYVCPHCHCFSVEDGVDLSGDTARRRRRWDACTLPGFSKVAGGADFHPTRRHRYYNWFFHKFVRAYLEFGKAQCVACGRCADQCPARIDIEEILLDITARYERRKRS